MDWNNADMSEVTSGNPYSKPHLVGPSNLAQKMHAVKVSVVAADKATEVITFFLPFHISTKKISSSP
jgi:hypothetical protein